MTSPSTTTTTMNDDDNEDDGDDEDDEELLKINRLRGSWEHSKLNEVPLIGLPVSYFYAFLFVAILAKLWYYSFDFNGLSVFWPR